MKIGLDPLCLRECVDYSSKIKPDFGVDIDFGERCDIGVVMMSCVVMLPK